MLTFIGHEIQKVAVGFHLYTVTGEVLILGLVGLALFLPAVMFSLHAGQLADRYNRKRILQICQGVLVGCSLVLAWLASQDELSVVGILVVLGVSGTAATYYSPASQALMPSLVPRAEFPRAVTWNSTIWQITAIVGPVMGGLIYERSGAVGAYLFDAGLLCLAALLTALLKNPVVKRESAPPGWQTALAGLGYIWNRPVLFGTITLDLFAVLLGGVTALLPVFAKDVLQTDEVGFGLLRAAPAVGAGIVALGLAWMPPMRQAGRKMLWAVALFGLAIVGFGLSRSLMLSLLCLAVAGGADMISVVVRHTMVQLMTPEEMRGRVSAVNLLFIRASNELGEFESGVVAHFIGPVACVVLGGVGTLAVTGFYAWRYPMIRRFDRLEDPQPSG